MHEKLMHSVRFTADPGSLLAVVATHVFRLVAAVIDVAEYLTSAYKHSVHSLPLSFPPKYSFPVTVQTTAECVRNELVEATRFDGVYAEARHRHSEAKQTIW
eukprot:3374886-Pleurochrysis_carterae.AAC.1